MTRTADEFVEFIQTSLPAKPENFDAIREANLSGAGVPQD